MSARGGSRRPLETAPAAKPLYFLTRIELFRETTPNNLPASILKRVRPVPMHSPLQLRPAGWRRLLIVGLLGAMLGFAGRAQSLTDAFADRDSDNSQGGSSRASNVAATLEPREPRHGGKPGGHSMWLQWTAPATGIATFTTAGSDFDTLLSVYVIDPSNPEKPLMERLRVIALNDDAPDTKSSLVQFGATAGTVYQIAVDGYAGAVGNIRLRWDLVRSDQPLPTILQVPPDRALKAGDPLTLTVDILDGKEVKLAWFYNETELLGEESNVLTIPNFQRGNVGRYRLRITADKVRFFSDPTEIQINSEGEINTLARDKLFDAGDSALVGHDNGDDNGNGRNASVASPAARGRARPAGPIGDSRGFNGTQIFNTTYAQADPGEPAHCGTQPNASYWLTYVAPADGQLALDTDGSDFDTVLEVYGLNGPLTGYNSLVSLGCDNDSGANGKTSRVRIPVELGKTYYIVVDGIGGVRGIAHLNYQLARPPASVLPSFAAQPTSAQAIIGARATFEVAVSGTAPFTFSWLHDGSPIPHGTNALLEIPTVQLADAGSYWVVVSNAVGHVASERASLSVSMPPSITLQPISQASVAGGGVEFKVTFEAVPAPTLQWYRDGKPIAGATNAVLALANVQPADTGRYAVEIINAAGGAVSEPATLLVWVPPTFRVFPVGQQRVAGTAIELKVEFDGYPQPTIQWLKDGKPLPDATNAVLRIDRAGPGDAGVYRVEISNVAGNAISEPAELLVLEPPLVTSTPSSQTVASGAGVTLTFALAGTPPLTVAWFKDDAPIADTAGPVLTLSSVQPAQSGRYRIEVTNAAGKAISDVVELLVLQPPRIRLQPTSQLVPTGGDATFSVELEGSEPLEFVWRHRDAVVAGATSPSLTLAGVGPADAGAYVLEVRNRVGSATSTPAMLTILVGAALRLDASKGSVELTAAAPDGQEFSIESLDTFPSGAWTETHRARADAEGIHVEQPVDGGTSRFFRVRLH